MHLFDQSVLPNSRTATRFKVGTADVVAIAGQIVVVPAAHRTSSSTPATAVRGTSTFTPARVWKPSGANVTNGTPGVRTS